MKVKIPDIDKEFCQKEIQELYTHSVITGCGKITFALVNEGVGFGDWHIVEYKTGLSVLSNIGKLTKTRFVNITNLIINMNPKKLKDKIDVNEIINQGQWI